MGGCNVADWSGRRCSRRAALGLAGCQLLSETTAAAACGGCLGRSMRQGSGGWAVPPVRPRPGRSPPWRRRPPMLHVECVSAGPFRNFPVSRTGNISHGAETVGRTGLLMSARLEAPRSGVGALCRVLACFPPVARTQRGATYTFIHGWGARAGARIFQWQSYDIMLGVDTLAIS